MISLFIFKSNVRGMQYGIGTYVRELTEALLCYTNIKVTIVNYQNSGVKEFMVETPSERYREIYIPWPKLPFLHVDLNGEKYAKAVVNLLAETISENEDVIFQMNYINDLPLLKILKDRYKFPVISVVHFFVWEQMFIGNIKKMNNLNINEPSNNTEFTICKEKDLYQNSDHVVTINPFMSNFLVSEYRIDPHKISIIRNGINTRKFSRINKKNKTKLKRKLGFYAHEKIILFSGRIDPDKGIFFLVEAFIEACKIRDDLRLVFIGQGNIQELLAKFNLFVGRISITGFLPPEKILEFYQIADIGVVPSIYEPCSYSRLEMIANEIPLILPRIDGFSEMLEGDQCLFINRHLSSDGEIFFNTNEFCDAILTLAGNRRLGNTLSINAFKNLIDLHSSSGMANEMINLYNTLLKNNN